MSSRLIEQEVEKAVKAAIAAVATTAAVHAVLYDGQLEESDMPGIVVVAGPAQYVGEPEDLMAEMDLQVVCMTHLPHDAGRTALAALARDARTVLAEPDLLSASAPNWLRICEAVVTDGGQTQENNVSMLRLDCRLFVAASPTDET